ncbi:MAG: hypothetical protein LBW85_08365 [Deltaproteobacteria bacterium]|jgi:hypothetical protein|nr:hypothetical protein [Deltaproteobacteria bacterium]
MRPRFATPALALAFLAAACAAGPLEPGRLSEVRSRADYVRLVKASLTNYEIWFFNEAGESLRVDVVNVNPELLSAARARWSGDRAFTDEIAKWLPEGRGRVVLLGLYNRRFRKEDFLNTGAFRARLLLEDGTLVPHDYAAQASPHFLADYFPAFNHWAKVFAVHFPTDPSVPASLEVQWPSGDCTVPLKHPARAVQAAGAR